MALTKDGLSELIQAKLDCPKMRASELVEMVIEEIKKTLESGDNVKIAGFGKWSVNEKKARPGRNPHTGEEMEISSRKVVTFNPSENLRESVNHSWKGE